MKNSRRAALAFLVLFFGWSGPALAETKPPSVKEILRTWTTRQEKVKTARFQMRCDRTIPNGSVSLMAELVGNPPGGKDATPAKDVLVNGTSQLTLSGPKMRYSYTIP